jgi:hypothetical protein
MNFFTRLFLALLLCTAAANIHAQVLLDENFNYTAGDTIGSNGWVSFSGSGTNAMKVVSPGLSFTGYPLSNVGNACFMVNSGQDSYKGFTGVTTGSLYVSFMVKIDTIRSGDYFFSMLPSSSVTSLTPRIFVRTSSGGFNFGLSKSTETTTYSSTVYTLGTTYVVVLKYIINSGSADDQMALYIFPSSYPSAEPLSPDVGPITGTATDNTLSRVALRQGAATSAPHLTIDGIRVSTSWSVSAPSAPSLVSPSDGATGVSITPMLDWNDVSGAASYNLQIATDSAFTNPVLNATGINTSSYTYGSLMRGVGTLNNNTQYFWRVSATNAGGTSSYSSIFDFTTIVAPPSVPNLVLPSNGAENVPLTTLLDWDNAPGADSYTVQVATDAGFTNIVINQAGISTSQYNITSGLSNNTQYFWRVSAANAGGTSPYSSVFSFTTVVAAPSSPVLSAPANGSAGVSLTPTLDWNDVSGASTYTVHVATDAGFSNVVINESGLTSSQYAVTSGLSNNTQYFWRVSAANAGGTSSYSSPFSFTTIVAAPSAPALSTPSNGASGVPVTPTLDWNDVSGASTYTVQVATDAAFSNLVINQSGVASSQYVISSALNNNTQYFWRVSATNAGGTSSYSSAFSFTTIIAAPSAPTLTSPASNATGVALAPLFDWNDVSGASSYRIQISTDSTFAATIKDTSGVPASQYQLPGGLLSNNVKYYWRVNAANSGGTSPYSGLFSFTTIVSAPSAPSLTAPANNATGIALAPLFDWNDVSGASSYRIQVSADSNFTTTIKDTSGVLSSQYQVPGGILNFQTKYYWRVNATNAGGTSAYSSRFSFTTLPLPPAQVQFTVIPAGLYNTGTGRLNMRDSIKVYLVDSANCLKVDSARGIIDSVTFSTTLSFSNVNTGKYYLFVYHRNHIAAATKLTQNVVRNSTVSYNFTTDSAKAFGNNMIKLGTNLWGMIPGDGNRDGFVDGLDQTIWINQNGSDGYFAGDYNGDGFVDGLDQTIWIIWNGQSYALPCNILDIFNFYPGGGTIAVTPNENNKTKR